VEEGKAAKRHKRLKNKRNTTKPHSPTRAENLMQREDGLNVTRRKDHKGHQYTEVSGAFDYFVVKATSSQGG
jgi:hypothetical protein